MANEENYSSHYLVETNDIIGIANQVRRLSGSTGKLTTEQMGTELSGLNFTLQEKTVEPTTEEQTIEADADYYGLSKIVVKAAEKIPSAEGVSF